MPNESGDFRQVGLRRPLANLLTAGLVEDVSIFSLQWRQREGGDAELHRQDLIARVRDFQPNLILMQHMGSTGLTSGHLKAMRRSCDFELIYHEADPYSRYLHPLPRAAAAVGRAADVVFTVGASTFAGNFARRGVRDVRWEPSPFDPERFHHQSLTSRQVPLHDVVLIANRNRPRLRGLPNWRDRIKFVQYLQDRFVGRLAVYGNGWEGPGAMGPVDFSRQDEAIRSGWVSANWDHFAEEARYFSNRLPISLAAGSVHATTHHDGYDELFEPPTRQFLLTSRSHEGLADAIEEHLGLTSPEQRFAAGLEAQKFAHARFRQDEQLVRFLNYREERVVPMRATNSWDIEAEPLHET